MPTLGDAAYGRSSAAVLNRIPRPVVSDESIEDGEEFAHGTDERHLGPLPGVTQATIEGLERRIVTNCNQGRHVEGAANAGAASGDVALPPLVLGDGIPLFPAGTPGLAMRLAKCEPRTGGALHVVYEAVR